MWIFLLVKIEFFLLLFGRLKSSQNWDEKVRHKFVRVYAAIKNKAVYKSKR